MHWKRCPWALFALVLAARVASGQHLCLPNFNSTQLASVGARLRLVPVSESSVCTRAETEGLVCAVADSPCLVQDQSCWIRANAVFETSTQETLRDCCETCHRQQGQARPILAALGGLRVCWHKGSAPASSLTASRQLMLTASAPLQSAQ